MRRVFFFYHISIIKSYLEERSIPEEKDDDDDDDDCRVFFLYYYGKYLMNSHGFSVWLIMKEKENISRKPEILQQLRHSVFACCVFISFFFLNIYFCVGILL